MMCRRPSIGISVPLAIVAILPSGHVAAAPREAPRPAIKDTARRSALLGEWELDLTRMPDNYGTPPRRVVYMFKDVGAGRWLTTIDITAPDGSIRHMAIHYDRDGRAAPGEGDLSEGDSAAFRSPAPNVLVMNIAKDKRPGSVRVYATSANGEEMTESAANIDDTGAPFVREFHYRRIR